MTFIDSEEPYFEDTTQLEQQNPLFHIVLVDIKHAAQKKEIRCIEKRLYPESNLNYVALSYRWGQYQETIIDSGLGYFPGITAFDLDDFYRLCLLISQEQDLQHLNYIWVDAICVDHYNIDKRQETLYHMPDIYGYANYILGIPDFHKGNNYLKDEMTLNDQETIYQLLHGNNNNNNNNNNMDIKATVRLSFQCLIDASIEWASRALIVSEYYMARRKNKFKFWFTLLNNNERRHDPISFFNYDLTESHEWEDHSIMYKEFHHTMAFYLNRKQSFLEMILKSKTSINQDRFYAIMPICKYKDKLIDKYTVGKWNINTMMTVKLKLYEIMNIDDKWKLLFMSGHSSSIRDGQPITLPSFATTTLHFSNNDASQYLFQEHDHSSIYNIDTVIDFTMSSCPPYKLHIKPKAYYTLNLEDPVICQNVWHTSSLRQRLQLDNDISLSVICIPFVNPVPEDIGQQIYLVGSFEKNKWTLTKMNPSMNRTLNDHCWELDTTGGGDGFDIY